MVSRASNSRIKSVEHTANRYVHQLIDGAVEKMISVSNYWGTLSVHELEFHRDYRNRIVVNYC